MAAAGAGAAAIRVDWDLEMFRRVKPKEREPIEATLRTLPNVNRFVGKMVTAMESANWGASPELTSHDMPFYALAAFTTHRISKENFFSLINFWAGVMHHGTQGILTFEINQKNKDLLIQWLTAPGANRSPVMTERLKVVFERMLGKPLSERRFFFFPDLHQSEGADKLESLHLSPFVSTFYQGRKWRIVPTMTLREVYANARYLGNGVRHNPVLGISSFKDMVANGEAFTRDIAFHFPHVLLPPALEDGLNVPWELFTEHDDYHVARSSSIPHPHQKALFQMAEVCQEVQEIWWKVRYDETGLRFPPKVWREIRSFEKDQGYAGQKLATIRHKLIDMDAPIYQFQEGLKPGEKPPIEVADCFWYFLGKSVTEHKFSPRWEETLWARICIKAQTMVKELQMPPETHFKSMGQFGLFCVKIKRLDLIFPPYKLEPIQRVWKKVKDPTALVAEASAKLKTLNEAEGKKYLKAFAERYFTPENCILLFNHSADIKCDLLTLALMIYLAKNFSAVIQTESFKKFQKESEVRCRALMAQIRASRFFKEVFLAAIGKPLPNEAFLLLKPPQEELLKKDVNGETVLDYAKGNVKALALLNA